MEQDYFDFNFDDENAGKTRKFLEFYVTYRMFAVGIVCFRNIEYET